MMIFNFHHYFYTNWKFFCRRNNLSYSIIYFISVCSQDIYFILKLVTKYYLFCCLTHFPFGHWELFQVGSCLLWTRPSSPLFYIHIFIPYPRINSLILEREKKGKVSERERERERERDIKHQLVGSHIPCPGDRSNWQPRHVPWSTMEPATFGAWDKGSNHVTRALSLLN